MFCLNIRPCLHLNTSHFIMIWCRVTITYAFLRFMSKIYRKFPGSLKLAHLWGNYTQWFVVLIDRTGSFSGRELCGPLFQFLLSSVGYCVIC